MLLVSKTFSIKIVVFFLMFLGLIHCVSLAALFMMLNSFGDTAD